MGQNLVSKALGSAGKQIFVLFIKTEFEQSNKQAYEENVSIFFDLLYKPFNKLFILDCDFDFVECSSINNTVIKQYKNGNFTIEDVHKELQDFKMSESLEMKAVGRVAQLGELYDARSELFLGRSIFAGNIPEALLIKTEISTSVTNIIPSESYADKFASLNVDPQLQLSILAEMFPLTRSGLYFSQQASNTNVLFRSIVHRQYFDSKEFSVTDEKFVGSIDARVVNEESATHFVSKIDFGLNSVFSVEDVQVTNISKDHDGTLNAAARRSSIDDVLEMLKEYIDAIVSGQNSTSGGLNLTDSYSVKVYSDIQEKESSQIVIKGHENLLQFLTNEFVPNLIIQNDAKKQPIAYFLYPIENLKKDIGLFNPRHTYDTIHPTATDILEFTRIVSNVDLANNQIRQMSKKLNENPDCTSENDLKTLNQIQAKYEATLGSFRKSFKKILEKIKKGEKEPSTLEKFRKDFQSNNYFGDDFRYKELLKLSHFENRFRFHRQLKEDHIQYLGRENDDVSFNKLFTRISAEFTTVYLLYYKQSWVEDHGDIWRTSIQTFYSKLKESNNSIVRNGFVVDCEFSHPYCDNMTQPAIHEYKNGRITSTDFVLKVEQEESSITTKIEEILAEILFIKENFESKTNCSRNKCFNGGNCTNSNTGFSCACPSGFQGTQCEKQINFCESCPCQNNGFCQNELNGYMCLCPKGFSGAKCATSINECSSEPSPCQNGGHCIDEEDGFTCACRLPWTGQRCQAQLNACKGNVCQNGGACTNTFDYWDFDCNCKPGYSGKHCEIDLDPCSRNSTLCKNEGVCQNTIGSYTCACAAGFAGKNCEINSDDVRCGGSLTSDSGSINYKSDQIINQEEGCLWIVAAQRKAASHMILSLTAAGFVMNDRHFLSVGYVNNFDYKEGAFVWKRFGSATPETIEVPTPVVFIHFVASGTQDTGTANKGFALNFRSEYYGGFNAGYKYSNIFLTGPNGSRRYPLAGNYGNSESTAIVVQPTAQNSSLNVAWWDLENGNDFVSIWILQSNFNYKRVEMLTGLRSTSSPRRYSNNFSSRNDPFLLVFYSDGSAEFSGFEFSWGS